jgi:hypothetical protein
VCVRVCVGVCGCNLLQHMHAARSETIRPLTTEGEGETGRHHRDERVRQMNTQRWE